jgi:hypothetical protein
MKQFLCVVLCCILIIGVGCSKVKDGKEYDYSIPDNVREDFYLDMVKCLEYANTALEKKNIMFLDDGIEILTKWSSILEEECSEIESDIYVQILISLYGYTNDYIKEEDSIEKLDTTTFYGKFLYNSIKETINMMKIDFSFE